MSKETGALTSGAAHTDWISPVQQKGRGVNAAGYLNLAISGTWSGTLTLQKRYSDATATTYDVKEYTANDAELIEDYETGVEYRIGFTTSGNYTSGTANVRLSK